MFNPPSMASLSDQLDLRHYMSILAIDIVARRTGPVFDYPDAATFALNTRDHQCGCHGFQHCNLHTLLIHLEHYSPYLPSGVPGIPYLGSSIFSIVVNCKCAPSFPSNATWPLPLTNVANGSPCSSFSASSRKNWACPGPEIACSMILSPGQKSPVSSNALGKRV
jgi:hypothetical protein